MKALLSGSGPPSDSLQCGDPCHPPTLSSSPQPLRQLQPPQHAQHAQHAQQGQHVHQAQQHSSQHVQQAQPAQHAQQAPQQPSQSQQPIMLSLLPGSNKLLTPTQVKELSWQNHLNLYQVHHTASIQNTLTSSMLSHKPYYTWLPCAGIVGLAAISGPQ